jgi:DNA-directed RNA polymerase subunit RPC12/RpoP
MNSMKITSYFQSTKNKKYGYDPETKTYNCIECGKQIKKGEVTCAKNGCESKFIFRVK